MVVAIDGPAASGKGTLAKRIAAHLGRPHLDTGLLYRAVAYRLAAAGHALDDASTATEVAATLALEGIAEADLRRPEMGEAASIVSAIPAVREALLALQRRFAAQPGGAVLDGRDIGTVVCPDAAVKLYVTASLEERARRRHREIAGCGDPHGFDDVLATLQRRDLRDEMREASPLKAAPDALQIDTTLLDAEGAFAVAIGLVEAGLARRRVAARL